MEILQCAACGYADLALSDRDAEMKSSSHEIKTGCAGKIMRSGGNRV